MNLEKNIGDLCLRSVKSTFGNVSRVFPTFRIENYILKEGTTRACLAKPLVKI